MERRMKTSQPARRFRIPLLRWLRRGRAYWILGFAVLVFLVVWTTWFRSLDTVRRWEAQAHDLRFRTRGPLPPNPNIVIVGIKATTLDPKIFEAHIGASKALRLMSENTWPWPRPVFAEAIERILAAGARVVAVDIVFAAERDGDEELAAVLRKYPGRVILASIVQVSVEDAAGGARHDTKVFFTPNQLFTEAVGRANVGFAKYGKEDNVMRRFDYRTSMMRESGFENLDDGADDLVVFAPLAVARFLGKEVPSGGNEILNFAGPLLTYPSIPFENLFIESTWRNDPATRGGEALRDKLVFIGPIAEVLHDVHGTPFEGETPGVEIHAQLAASLLEGRTIRDAPMALMISVTLCCALGAAAAVLLIANPIWQALVILGGGGVFWFGSQFLFTHGGLLVPAVQSLASLGVTGAFGVVYLFVVERWEKAHTRKVLERSINKRIAKVVLQNAEEFAQARRGKRQPVTILFSDIRGFTTWSEKAEPEHLVGQLNEYFERMVDIVERDGSLGNAQKFIGDAILAAWGDTPENRFGDPEDARRAVAAALHMREALKELNLTWDARPDRSVINIGIGINHGQVVVGEVGHPDRGEYTVLGDGVNFASRLESATKQFHTDCLVGESVEALTREHFIYRHADFIRVKGKTKPVNVFIPISERSVSPPAWLDDYHRARELYLDKKFEEAADLFRSVQARIGKDDYLCALYLTLCTRFAAEPPPAGWDGSRELTEK